jgi:hypothetical protein
MKTTDTIALAKALGLTDINDLVKVERLQKIARRLHTLAEIMCNRSFTPREEKEQERLEVEAQALILACPNARAVEHNRDPRGLPIYFVTRDGHHDSWHSIEIEGTQYQAVGVYGGW